MTAEIESRTEQLSQKTAEVKSQANRIEKTTKVTAEVENKTNQI